MIVPLCWTSPQDGRFTWPPSALTRSVASGHIYSKLLWPRQGATERSVDDIRGIVRAHRGQLDLAYLEGMIGQLGLEALWAPLRPDPDGRDVAGRR